MYWSYVTITRGEFYVVEAKVYQKFFSSTVKVEIVLCHYNQG